MLIIDKQFCTRIKQRTILNKQAHMLISLLQKNNSTSELNVEQNAPDH